LIEIAIQKRLGSFTLDARLEAPDSGVTALFGRSGMGKTSVINALAGLLRPDRGRIVVGGTTLFDSEHRINLPPEKRRLGYVFQEARLFPHYSVRGNLLYGAKSDGAKDRAGPSLDAVVDLLGIKDLLARRPADLSGGEKQRVAIGRALLAHPKMLLMDEPLASLDEQRRAEILPYIERLRDIGVPILYVSHSVAEVARLATTVVILNAGKVTAVGPVLDILPLADASDGGSVLDAVVADHDETFQLTRLTSPAGDLQVPRLTAAAGSTVRAYIRSRDVMLSLQRPQEISALNVLAGKVTEITERGAQADVRLDCNGATLVARLTAKSVQRLALAPGRPVFAVIKSVSFERS
jgi:molybdate transport system ATP-binding protein